MPQEIGDELPEESSVVEEEEIYVDAEDMDEFKGVPPNTDFEEMAENYFARVDEIHQQERDEEDCVLDFEDFSSEEEQPDMTLLMEELLRGSAEPLFHGSQSSRLQITIILMSLCTLYSVSHHCLDEILTFLKYDVLPADNTCPKSSYEMKRLLLKLGLSHETIHCCQCGKTLYWKENLNLDHCPKCQNSRYIPGSNSIPT